MSRTPAPANGGSVADAAKPRVLHVLKSLPLGGIESWLMHVLRHDRASVVAHELLLMVEKPGAYEAEARSLGVRIHKVVKGRSWFSWLPRFYHFLRREGPFAAVHSHSSRIGGAILAVAALARVPARIAHQHDARSAGPDFTGGREAFLRRANMVLTKLTATRRIGITETAIEDIAGPGWQRHKDCSILLYGFDFSSFDGAEARAAALRRSLDLRPGNRVVGHVGRFDPVKNHDFLLKVFARLARADPEARLVMVGRGSLEPEVRKLGEALGVADRLRFAGSTRDIAAYMALFDLFLFPSFSEGLGIVCVEAQAAGTPVLASDTVPREAAVVKEGFHVLPLGAGEDLWARRSAELLAMPKSDAQAWRNQVDQSAFGIERCVRDLHGVYREELALKG
ncbi:glycosyltransferase [Sphingomonas sp. URHD0057]|uniref:glycosyltransferase n=1 Tax=Sphingomonas sp. URHD0057 TaxID=1380389 RepID=UPI00048E3E6C|nr:glycosyltransferase [Sphingomonas sp. URHD0057]